MSTDGPVLVIEVENRRNRHDIHVGFVIRLQRADVAPVERFFLVFIDEVVSVYAVVVHHLRKNIFAEIVARAGILRVLQQHWDEHIGVEEIDSHRSRDLIRIRRRAQLRLFWLLLKSNYPVITVHSHDAEAGDF